MQTVAISTLNAPQNMDTEGNSSTSFHKTCLSFVYRLFIHRILSHNRVIGRRFSLIKQGLNLALKHATLKS